MSWQRLAQTVQAKLVALWKRLLAIHGEQEHRIITLLCVLGVAIFGIWLTVASRAETFLQTAEAETGTVEGNAQVTAADTDASGGGSVLFGTPVTDAPPQDPSTDDSTTTVQPLRTRP